MPSSLEKLSTNRVKLTIEMPFDELKPSLDKAYKDIAAQIVMRGLVDAPDINPEVATHAAITGLKVDGLVASAPRGKYRLPE